MRVGDDLHVHAVLLVFPRVEGPVGGDPVDRQQRSVQEDERLGRGGLHRLFHGGGEGGQEVDGLGDAPVGGGGAHLEPGRELSVGVTASQVGQHQQRLPSGGQPTPSGALITAVCGQFTSEVAQCRAGQIDAGWVDKHAEAPGGTGDLGREPVYQELLHVQTPPPPQPPPHCGRLESAPCLPLLNHPPSVAAEAFAGLDAGAGYAGDDVPVAESPQVCAGVVCLIGAEAVRSAPARSAAGPDSGAPTTSGRSAWLSFTFAAETPRTFGLRFCVSVSPPFCACRPLVSPGRRRGREVCSLPAPVDRIAPGQRSPFFARTEAASRRTSPPHRGRRAPPGPPGAGDAAMPQSVLLPGGEPTVCGSRRDAEGHGQMPRRTRWSAGTPPP